jgi:hypothetical protein
MWPCPDARRSLREAADGSIVTLALTMSQYLGEAVGDLDDLPAGLYARFLGWLR